MGTIAGGIILALCLLALLPMIFSLVAMVLYGIFLLVVVLFISAVVIAALYFGFFFTRDHLINGYGVALVAIIATASLVYSYFKAIWDFGDLKTAFSYYGLLLKRAPGLAAIKQKEEEIEKFRSYRAAVRAKRKVLIDREKAEDRIRKLHNARDQISKDLNKFTASTDFRIETNDAEHKLDLYFEGAKVGSVVEAGYNFSLTTERGQPAPNQSPMSPTHIAGEIKSMLRKRVKQARSLKAER